MADKNNSWRVEPSIKRTRFLGHLGLIAGVYRELEVDKLIDEKLPKIWKKSTGKILNLMGEKYENIYL